METTQQEFEAHGSPPPCPKCGSSMQLRTARRGRNAGNQFWGCSAFPSCRGTRDVDDEPTKPSQSLPTANSVADASEQPRSFAALPVTWVEGAARTEYVSEYVSVGAMPGIFREELAHQPDLDPILSQCVLLAPRARPRSGASDHARLVSALLVKMLQRGRNPLPTLAVEREALRASGLAQSTINLADEGEEEGWELRPGSVSRINPKGLMVVAAERSTFEMDPAFDFVPGSHTALLQSDAEVKFLDHWVPETLGPSAGHWFTPQASLDTLLGSRGLDEQGARRVDFLFHHPGSPPLAIEIDGSEHESAILVDEARDESLRAIGIEVLRVPNDEIDAGAGPALDQVRHKCVRALTATSPSRTDKLAGNLILDCSDAARVQFALARAIGYGWLTAGEEWLIDLVGAGTVSISGVYDLLRLLIGFDTLYGGCSVPTVCTVRSDDGISVTWQLDDDGEWRKVSDNEAKDESIRIAIERRASPYHRIESNGRPDFIIRRAFLPVDFSAEQQSDFGHRVITPRTYEEARPVLTNFLRFVFRKRNFRPMQGQAIFNTLRQNDSVVLLPTGAGKSLIYQLAGLLMPGVTLVVDPLISLIEDQVEGLRSYGIDRAAPIASNLSTPEDRRRLLLSVERGEYYFVLHSPERMQSPAFRNALRALTEVALVNLAVIDEAHCVSEWGHDFRPAYLHLADNLRRFGRDDTDAPPPLLALTGTASRAVLRDMLADLGIDKNRSDSLIRPESFDRAELTFEVVRTAPPEDPKAKLRGVMNSIPRRFGLPSGEFFRRAGRNTASGIVFVPTVKARDYGLKDAREAVRSATRAQVTMYSGGPPYGTDRAAWDVEKRENASSFKQNDVPILVATKAYGMGIDKPNVRYTVHFGMPSSLESFYQEVGRAGRDRKPARCVAVFSEYDPDRSDRLLDPNLDLPALRQRFDSETGNVKTRDDISRALWFHLQGFNGVNQDIDDLKNVLDIFEDISTPRLVELPFDSDEDKKRKEKSIYRLLRIGVIADYAVDFGACKFDIQVRSFDFDHCRKSLLDYVHSAQPAKAVVLARRLDEIDTENANEAALELASNLIEFTYDVIERSRRRMIQEAVLLARQAEDNDEIRARLLDYLQEGFGAERIEQLLESEEIDLAEWHDLACKAQTPMDAGELRGLCIRALETYPDHPGLLLTRAIAETMCSDHDDTVSTQGLATAFRRAFVDYELAQQDIEAAIDALFELALTRANGLGFPLVVSLLELDEVEPALSFAATKGLRGGSELKGSNVRAATATRRLRDMVIGLETAVDRVVNRYEAPGVDRALTGA